MCRDSDGSGFLFGFFIGGQAKRRHISMKLSSCRAWLATDHSRWGDFSVVIEASDEAEARLLCLERGLSFEGKLRAMATGITDEMADEILMDLRDPERVLH